MNLNEAFLEFINSISLEDDKKINEHIKSVIKKLNKSYYDLDSDYDNMLVVGSLGRKTYVTLSSDVDLLFILPNDLYEKYDNRKNNGQSGLLSDVRKVLLERFSRTEIGADGQVVDIQFDDCLVELVPCFAEEDGSFTYADTNGGGSWKNTKPRLEINECEEFSKSYIQFRDICKIIRGWKHENGVKINGLLIDTFVYNYLKDNEELMNKEDINFDFYQEFYNIINYMSNQSEDQQYWHALGSNQKIYNRKNYNYIKKSSKTIKELDMCDEESSRWSMIRTLLGSKFPAAPYEKECSDNEEFITDRYELYLKYDIKIDALVTQDGWRPFFLREMLNGMLSTKRLKFRKKLKFTIIDSNIPGNYTVFWKVRNLGDESIRKNCIRGKIYQSIERIENTAFNGPHYVECFAVQGNICVARARLSVPIDDC